MTPFGPYEESRLLACLKSAVSLVSDGLSPDEALAKSAQENQLHPHSVKLAVQSYNVGRLTHQREKCAGESVSCLLGEYPIARLENVESLLYPQASSLLASRKAAALTGVSAEYSQPPSIVDEPTAQYRTKFAATELPINMPAPRRTNEFNLRRLCQLKDAATREIAKLDVSLQQSFDALETKLAAVTSYCRHNTAKVAEVEFNSRQLFGKGVTELFDHATRGLKAARSLPGDLPPSCTSADQARSPYSLVKAALSQAAEHAADLRLVKVAQQKIASEVAKVFPTRHEPTNQPSRILRNLSGSSPQKAGGILGSLATGAAGGLASSLRQTTAKPPSEIVSGLADELADPTHLAKLKSMQAKAMLSDLMANDEVISGYDPAEITEAYNELMQLSPNLSTQGAIVRPLLRKRLTGGLIEPFDAEQLTKIDNSFRQPSGISPTKIPTAA